MRLRQVVRTDLVSVLATGVVLQALAFCAGPLVARLLGPEGRGVVVVVLAMSMVATALTFSTLGMAVSVSVARHGGRAWDAVGAQVPRWMLWWLAPALATAGGILFYLPWSTSTAVLAAEGFAMTLTGGCVGLFRGMAMGEQKVRRVNLADVLLVLGYVLGVTAIFVVQPHSTPEVVLLCQLVGQTASLTVLLRTLGRPRRGSAVDVRDVHQLMRASYFSAWGVLDRLGVDQLLLAHLLGTVALGFYAIATSIGALPAVLLGGMAKALTPKMAAREAVDAARFMRRWLLAALGVSCGLAVALELVVGPMVRVLFGEDFVPATTAARILIVANVLFALRLMLVSACQAQGRASQASWVLVAGIGVLIACLTAGAQWGELEGATIGVLVAAVVTIVPLLFIVSWSGETVRATTAKHRA